jgi:hypothetical protein
VSAGERLHAGIAATGTPLPGENMDVLYLAAFAAMAGLSLALAEFCDTLQNGDRS